VHYIISSYPTTPNLSLLRSRALAHREGHRLARDHDASTFSLIDARLRVPLRIANAIEFARPTHL
jgi:hypothetical protein